MRSCSYPECKKNPGEKGDLAGVLNTLPNKDRVEFDSPREGNELITPYLVGLIGPVKVPL